jgi:hypothetical protein
MTVKDLLALEELGALRDELSQRSAGGGHG